MRVFLIVAFLFTFFNSVYANSKLKESYDDNKVKYINLTKGIENLIKETDPFVNIGVYIQNAKTEEVVFSKNSNRYFVPASVTKYLPSIVALNELGSEHSFLTELFVDIIDSSKDIPTADLYVKFNGNPNLTINDLYLLLRSIPKGKYTFRNVYLDDTMYELPFYPDTTMIEDLELCYSAPISPLMLNKNSVKFRITPSEYNNDAATVFQHNHDFYNFIEAEVESLQNCDTKNSLERNKHKNGYKITGCINTNDKPKKMCLAVDSPIEYTSKVVTNILKQQRVKYTGDVLLAKTPGYATNVSQHKSKNLEYLLTGGMQLSDNFIMNAIFLNISADPDTKSWKDAGKNLCASLSKILDLDLNDIKLEDGAGMGRNLITPKQVSNILVSSYNTKIKPALFRILPVAGKSGTIEQRMFMLKPGTIVRAKTGTSSTVTSLAGYLTIGNNDYVIVVMINSIAKQRQAYVDLIDKIYEFASFELS